MTTLLSYFCNSLLLIYIFFIYKSRHLEDNNLSKISKGWLYGLNSLVYLNISYNRIDQIKSGWEYCAELEEL